MVGYDRFSKNKNFIIELLLYNDSLNAKQIFHKLKRQFGLDLTYQAVHKILKQMVIDKVLVKDNINNYSISKEWAESNLKEAENIYKKLDKKIQLVNLDSMHDYEAIVLVFDGILSLGWFIINVFMQYQDTEKRCSLALWRFCYSVVGLDSEHLEGLTKTFKSNNWVVFVEEDNPLDRTFAKTLQTYGLKKVKFGISCSTTLTDFMVNGDFIMQISYPSKFRKLWELQNRSPKNLSDFDLGKHFLLMREFSTKIHVLLIRDKQLADEYREEYLSKI